MTHPCSCKTCDIVVIGGEFLPFYCKRTHAWIVENGGDKQPAYDTVCRDGCTYHPLAQEILKQYFSAVVNQKKKIYEPFRNATIVVECEMPQYLYDDRVKSTEYINLRFEEHEEGITQSRVKYWRYTTP